MGRPEGRTGPTVVLLAAGIVIVSAAFFESLVRTGTGRLDGVAGVLGLAVLAAGIAAHVAKHPAAWRRFGAEYRLVVVCLAATALALLLPRSALRSLPAIGLLPEWIGRLGLLFLVEGVCILGIWAAGRRDSSRWAEAASERAGSLANAVIVVQVSLGLLVAVNVIAANRLTHSIGVLDLTEAQSYSLSEETTRLLDDLPNHPGELRATYVDFGTAGALGEMALDLLDRYDGYSTEMSLVHLDARRDREGVRARFRELGLEDLDLSGDTVVFTYHEPGSRTPRRRDVEVLPRTLLEHGLGSEKFLGEEYFTSAIREVIFPLEKVYFLTGHGERSITDAGPGGYSKASEQIERLAFETEPLSLAGRSLIPEDAGVIVMAGATSPLGPDEARVLARYLEGGGSLILLTDPDMDLTGRERATARIGLEEYLAGLGITVQRDFVCMAFEPTVGVASGRPTAGWTWFLVTDSYGYHPAVEPLSRRQLPVKMVQACPVTANEHARAEGAELRARTLVNMMLSPPGIPNAVSFAAKLTPGRSERELEIADDATDLVRRRIQVAAAAEKVRRTPGGGLSDAEESVVTRVVVVGDTEFASNVGLIPGSGYYAPGNGVLLTSAVSWAAERESLISIDPKVWETEQVALEEREARLAKTVGVYAVPFLVLVLGIGIALSRRK